MKSWFKSLPLLCSISSFAAEGPTSTADLKRTNATSKPKEYLSTTAINAETREFKPGDSFIYAIKEDPAKGGGGIHTIKVNDAGEAIFPVSFETKLYVKVDVTAFTLGEIRKKIKDLLDEEYYNDATVLLEFVGANRTPRELEVAPQVQIYGEMQGTVTLREDEEKRISDAILSLSRTPFADLRRVRLHRVDPISGNKETRIVNVDKILREGDRSGDEILQNGDRIEVRPKTFNF